MQSPNLGYLQGEQAMHVPGESMTEEQYTDDDGNLITRKVTYTLRVEP